MSLFKAVSWHFYARHTHAGQIRLAIFRMPIGAMLDAARSAPRLEKRVKHRIFCRHSMRRVLADTYTLCLADTSTAIDAPVRHASKTSWRHFLPGAIDGFLRRFIFSTYFRSKSLARVNSGHTESSRRFCRDAARTPPFALAATASSGCAPCRRRANDVSRLAEVFCATTWRQITTLRCSKGGRTRRHEQLKCQVSAPTISYRSCALVDEPARRCSLRSRAAHCMAIVLVHEDMPLATRFGSASAGAIPPLPRGDMPMRYGTPAVPASTSNAERHEAHD